MFGSILDRIGLAKLAEAYDYEPYGGLYEDVDPIEEAFLLGYMKAAEDIEEMGMDYGPDPYDYEDVDYDLLADLLEGDIDDFDVDPYELGYEEGAMDTLAELGLI